MSAVAAEISESETRERPIIFSGEMVRAILDGRKTQTRRVVKPQIPAQSGPPPGPWEDGWTVCGHEYRCPYGQPGDRLWVRETFAHAPEHDCVYYRADDPTEYDSDGPWRPSIFMPRWASRITLEITDIRVERVQDISEADAVAEGVDAIPVADVPRPAAWSRRQDFSRLWDKINAKRGYGWAENPFCWVIEFRKL